MKVARLNVKIYYVNYLNNLRYALTVPYSRLTGSVCSVGRGFGHAARLVVLDRQECLRFTSNSLVRRVTYLLQYVWCTTSG